jgi:hypothetical protein
MAAQRVRDRLSDLGSIDEGEEEELSEPSGLSDHGGGRGCDPQGSRDHEEGRETEDLANCKESSSTEANDPDDSDFEVSDSSLDMDSDSD